MIRELIAVGLGGAAGSMARYALSYGVLAGHTLLGFPAGTFAVNAVGSLLIGILLEGLSSAEASRPSRPSRPMPCGCCGPGISDRLRPT